MLILFGLPPRPFTGKIPIIIETRFPFDRLKEMADKLAAKGYDATIYETT